MDGSIDCSVGGFQIPKDWLLVVDQNQSAVVRLRVNRDAKLLAIHVDNGDNATKLSLFLVVFHC